MFEKATIRPDLKNTEVEPVRLAPYYYLLYFCLFDISIDYNFKKFLSIMSDIKSYCHLSSSSECLAGSYKNLKLGKKLFCMGLTTMHPFFLLFYFFVIRYG